MKYPECIKYKKDTEEFLDWVKERVRDLNTLKSAHEALKHKNTKKK